MRILRLTLLITISLALSAITANAQRARPQRIDRVDTQTQTRQMNIAQELRCRGGDLQFNVTPSRANPATGEQMMNVVMSFRHGASPAGAQSDGLPSGHCSWIDRAMDGNEPWRLMWEDVNSAQAKALLNGGLSQPDRSPTAAESWPDAQSIPRYLSTPDHYWTFWVRNNGKDYFDVERNGYWKRSNLDRIPGQTSPMNTPPGNLQLPTMSQQDRIDRGTTTKDLQVGTITGELRWPKEYGMPRGGGNQQKFFHFPCAVFEYRTTISGQAMGGDVKKENPDINVVPEENGYYICRYSINGLPLNQAITVSASLPSDPIDWFYDTDIKAQPPFGYQRTVTGHRTVTLTRDEPNAVVNFEIVYAPIGSRRR